MAYILSAFRVRMCHSDTSVATKRVKGRNCPQGKLCNFHPLHSSSIPMDKRPGQHQFLDIVVLQGKVSALAIGVDRTIPLDRKCTQCYSPWNKTLLDNRMDQEPLDSTYRQGKRHKLRSPSSNTIHSNMASIDQSQIQHRCLEHIPVATMIQVDRKCPQDKLYKTIARMKEKKYLCHKDCM
jgi:hypothetical protein